MVYDISLYLIFSIILSCAVSSTAFPDLGIRSKLDKALSPWTQSSSLILPSEEANRLEPQIIERAQFDGSGVNFNPNGSAFLWLSQDTYAGKTFFDNWSFFEGADLTHGNVHFVNQSIAISNGFVSVQDDGTVIMKADDTTELPFGVNRSSVRISSNNLYTTGLFILDLNKAPWGCAIWPAFWTVGPNWPVGGEIDILEGVHDNEHNQVAWHTNDGCLLDPSATFTGNISLGTDGTNNTNCYGLANSNSGCDITEWSRASYGPFFEAQGGGVLAMKWDENDISVWSFFRAAIPPDITAGAPNPSLWGVPSAKLMSTMCDIPNFFVNHSIIFDITFCGDWAGNSYATSGCPDTCLERLMDPTNFVNATWSINSLKVYKKVLLAGNHSLTAGTQSMKFKSGFGVVIFLFVTLLVVSIGTAW